VKGPKPGGDGEGGGEVLVATENEVATELDGMKLEVSD